MKLHKAAAFLAATTSCVGSFTVPTYRHRHQRRSTTTVALGVFGTVPSAEKGEKEKLIAESAESLSKYKKTTKGRLSYSEMVSIQGQDITQKNNEIVNLISGLGLAVAGYFGGVGLAKMDNSMAFQMASLGVESREQYKYSSKQEKLEEEIELLESRLEYFKQSKRDSMRESTLKELTEKKILKEQFTIKYFRDEDLLPAAEQKRQYGTLKRSITTLHKIDPNRFPEFTDTGKSGKLLPPDSFIQQYLPDDLAYVVPADYGRAGKVQFDSALDKGIESFLLASRQDEVDTTSVLL